MQGAQLSGAGEIARPKPQLGDILKGLACLLFLCCNTIPGGVNWKSIMQVSRTNTTSKRSNSISRRNTRRGSPFK